MSGRDRWGRWWWVPRTELIALLVTVAVVAIAVAVVVGR